LLAYNYIDSRGDFEGAMKRLLDELGRDYDLPAPMTGADRIGVFEGVETEARSLPEALQALLDAVRDPSIGVALSVEQAKAIAFKKNDL
jgi:hypothetical protein